MTWYIAEFINCITSFAYGMSHPLFSYVFIGCDHDIPSNVPAKQSLQDQGFDS